MGAFLFVSCSVCFGDPNSLQSRGLVLGVFFLLAVVVSVLVAIGCTAYRWARRAKELETR